MRKEIEILEKFIREKDLRYTPQREEILKVFLSVEKHLGDGISRFEHQYDHEHHDHLICVKCGSYIEVVKPKIEELQEKLAKEKQFTPLRHKLQIFGICGKCSK